MIRSTQQHSVMPMFVGEIIRRLMEANGIRKKIDLSRKTGVPAATVAKLLDQPELQPYDKTLEPIAKYFKITLAQLRGYESIPGVTDSGELQNGGLPLLEVEQIGPWLTRRLDADKIQQRVAVSSADFSGEAFVFTVTDAAVSEVAGIGETLIVDPAAMGNENGLSLIMRDGKAAFRYLSKDLDRTIFTSENPRFRPIDAEDCNFIGFVVARPEISFKPRYDGKPLVETNPELFADEAIELDLFRECGKHLDEFYDGKVTKDQRRVLQADLYQYCVQKGITAEALRADDERKELSENYPDANNNEEH